MSSDTWEFECPRFIDFCSGVQASLCLDGTWTDLNALVLKFENPKPVSKEELAAINSKSSTPVVKTFTEAFSRLINSTDSIKLAVKNIQSRCLSESDVPLPFMQASKVANKRQYCQRKLLFVDDPKYRRLTCPVTPICLRRTSKTRSKTSEELELEKIAELQKQTLGKIRSNQLFMKRMKQIKL